MQPISYIKHIIQLIKDKLKVQPFTENERDELIKLCKLTGPLNKMYDNMVNITELVKKKQQRHGLFIVLYLNMTQNFINYSTSISLKAQWLKDFCKYFLKLFFDDYINYLSKLSTSFHWQVFFYLSNRLLSDSSVAAIGVLAHMIVNMPLALSGIGFKIESQYNDFSAWGNQLVANKDFAPSKIKQIQAAYKTNVGDLFFDNNLLYKIMFQGFRILAMINATLMRVLPHKLMYVYLQILFIIATILSIIYFHTISFIKFVIS